MGVCGARTQARRSTSNPPTHHPLTTPQPPVYTSAAKCTAHSARPLRGRGGCCSPGRLRRGGCCSLLTAPRAAARSNAAIHNQDAQLLPRVLSLCRTIAHHEAHSPHTLYKRCRARHVLQRRKTTRTHKSIRTTRVILQHSRVSVLTTDDAAMGKQAGHAACCLPMATTRKIPRYHSRSPAQKK